MHSPINTLQLFLSLFSNDLFFFFSIQEKNTRLEMTHTFPFSYLSLLVRSNTSILSPILRMVDLHLRSSLSQSQFNTKQIFKKEQINRKKTYIIFSLFFLIGRLFLFSHFCSVFFFSLALIFSLDNNDKKIQLHCCVCVCA